MLRSDILSTAAECVTVDRASTYGAAENSFGLIAAYWSAHLDTNVTAVDVAAMMALLKLARVKTSPAHGDNWIDLAGYAACGGELATEQPEAAKILAEIEISQSCGNCKHGAGGSDQPPCINCDTCFTRWEPRA